MKIPVSTKSMSVDWKNIPYHDFGIARYLERKVEDAIVESINCAVPDNIEKIKTEITISRNLTLRQISLSGDFVTTVRLLQVDVNKQVADSIEGFCLTDGLQAGSLSWNPKFSHTHFQQHIKSLATRKRFLIRSTAFLVPAPQHDQVKELSDNCHCPRNFLYPLGNHPNVGAVVIWRCAACEAKYICACAKGVLEHYASRDGYDTSDSKKTLKEIKYREGICHICSGLPSSICYRSPMYGGSNVLNYYYPYVSQLMILENIDIKVAENKIRDRLGVPRIGEGWVNETQLANIVRYLFPDLIVEREASPEWLDRQRFDIYLPQIGLAVEYQGQQHFYPVGVFGGEDAFRRTVERDALKREKAKAAGIQIVEFRYDEQLTEDLVLKRLRPIVEHLRERQNIS